MTAHPEEPPESPPAAAADNASNVSCCSCSMCASVWCGAAWHACRLPATRAWRLHAVAAVAGAAGCLHTRRPLPASFSPNDDNRQTAAAAMGEALSAQGHCACGALSYTLTPSGPPRLSAYCHCTRCQRFNGAPFVHTMHLPYAAVQWHPSPPAPPPRVSSELLRNDEERAQQQARPDGAWSEKMHVFEAMKERKWKLRCRECGSPMGSWNAAKGQSVLPHLRESLVLTESPLTDGPSGARHWRASRRRARSRAHEAITPACQTLLRRCSSCCALRIISSMAHGAPSTSRTGWRSGLGIRGRATVSAEDLAPAARRTGESGTRRGGNLLYLRY
jgi:hypothetical protein